MNLQPNRIKMLGAYGSKFKNMGTTCVQVSDKILIDAGNIINPLGERALDIEHIFLSHLHFDHILDLPFLIESFFEKRLTTLNIYGTKETIEGLKEYVFNWHIWPDFSYIKLLNNKKALNFVVMEYQQQVQIDGVSIKAVQNNHTLGSCGFVITQNSRSLLFTSDTTSSQTIVDEINANETITSVIIEVSFPNALQNLALESKHMTPALLQQELQKIQKDVAIFVDHLKPLYIHEIIEELRHIGYRVRVLDDYDTICY